MKRRVGRLGLDRQLIKRDMIARELERRAKLAAPVFDGLTGRA